ncbi:hypothetical protein [Micromonospora chalcea]|uniref:hypothetical protein n=1 Tax=Micromonospora chalcea TaxID=1874 RepID=UPI003D73AF13
MGPVRKYKVNQGGYETVLKLNDADAKLYPGAELVEDVPAEVEGDEPSGKSRAAANKGRTPANKSKAS